MEDGLSLSKGSFEEERNKITVPYSANDVYNTFLNYPSFKKFGDSGVEISYGKNIIIKIVTWSGKDDGTHVCAYIKFKARNKLLRIKKIKDVALRWGAKYGLDCTGGYRVSETFSLNLYSWHRMDWNELAKNFAGLFTRIQPYFKDPIPTPKKG